MASSNYRLIQGATSNAPIIYQKKIPSSVANLTPPQSDHSLDHMEGDGPDYQLQYPLDRPKYFMVFDIYNYSRRDLTEIGQMTRAAGINSIIMPLSETLIDTTQQMYDSHVKVGTVAGGLTNMAGGPLQDWNRGQGAFPGKALAGAAAAGAVVGGINAMAGQSTSTAATSASLVPGIEALLGFAPNQFFTVLFVGPEYKRHRLQWNMSPRNFKEADTLRKIIKTFKNRMSPDLYPGGFIWKFPKIFWIGIYSNSKFMYKFKPAVLETFSVNYTPGGRAAFYRSKDASDTGNNPPEGVQIAAQFLELEYWLDGNVNDNNNPWDSYTRTGEAAAEWESVKAYYKNMIDNMEEGVVKSQLQKWYNSMFGP